MASEPSQTYANRGAAGRAPPPGPSTQVADLVRNAAEGTVVVDGEGIVLFANPAAETLLGSAPGGAVGLTLGYPAAGEAPTVITLRRPGSDATTVEMRAARTSWDGRAAFVVNLHDITARMRADEERRRLRERSDRLNQVLRAIVSVNQIVMRESDPGRLIRGTCDRLVNDGGFGASWLVLVDEDGSLVDVAESEPAVDRFAALTEAFARGVVPECCRRAQREGRVVRLGGAKGGGGCGSCELCAAMMPTDGALTACLTHGERTFGYITVLLESPVDGGSEEEALLRTIADDLGFALHGREASLGQKRSQRLLEEIERVAGVGGWEWDVATDAFTVSEEWRRIHGCGDGPIGLSDVTSLCLPEDRERWATSLQSLREGHEAIEVDHRIVKPDSGETRVVRSRSGSAEEGVSGARTVRGITQDITTAQQATEQIRFQARMLAAIGEAVIVVDPEGTILFWNDAAHSLYGWSAEEAVGRNVVGTVPAPGMLEDANALQEHLAGGGTWSGEFMMQSKDGRTFPALLTYAPVFGDDGALEAIIGVAADLSDLTRAEEALGQVSRRLETHVSAGQVGLWEWDLDTDAVSFSEEWKRQVGYADDELSDDLEQWRSRVHPDDLDPTLAEIEASLADGRPHYRAEFRLRHRNGSYRSILAQASIVRDADGRPVRMVGSHVDLTDLREAEESQRTAESHLRQAQKMESVGLLAGGVAHDFNNVLGVILGISELSLLSEDLPAPVRADFEEIHQAGSRAATLTRQLLAFARQQTIQPQVVDLNEAVAGMTKMLSRLIGEDLELTWKPGHGIWPVKVDPAQIDQVLANLIVNARDAVLSGRVNEGKISLQTSKVEVDGELLERHPYATAGDYVVLSVTDNGAGMDEATLVRVFEPFFTTKDPGSGTGLGLATVYGIAKQNQGFVTAYSELDEGTTIRFYLPRLVGSEAKSATQSEPTEMARGTETLLVVEDDVAVLGVVSRILEKLGYELLVAETPKHALELAREHGEIVSLLMTDVVMPGMNGRELADAVVALRPAIKCLFVSGYTQDLIAHRGVLDEGTHFLEKPFTANALATAVRRALDDPT